MKTLLLFDVDGTLTESRKVVKQNMIDTLNRILELKNKGVEVDIGIVGGSNYEKQVEQLTPDVLKLFKYVFSENGLVAYKDNKIINKTSIANFLGEDKIQTLINASLKCMSKINIPVKRGTFIEFRNGMINLCPVGRSCSQEERDQFYKYDLENNVRQKMVEQLSEELKELNLSFSIGGQISIDVFPKGWDKTYCLQFLEGENYNIHFFGDKTYQGGNDYEIYNSSKVNGNKVTCPEDTILLIEKILESIS